MAEVELKSVKKTFFGGDVPVLKEISLKVPDGTFTTVVGPSGCGKSTLLRIVAGLEKADEGEVLIGGKVMNQVLPAERNIAMVFQNYALYPHKRVFDNIAMGLRLRGFAKDKIKKRVEEVTQLLEIQGLLLRYPRQLSGGQQQRVALARTLVREPQVFLLDEPLSNLDAQIREATRSELKKLFKGLRATVLYVTHDQTEAMMMSDLLVVMEQGLIRQVGEPPKVYGDPSHRFVAEFIGSPRINMIPGSLKGGQFISEGGAILVTAGVQKEGKVLMGIRPEHLDVGGEREFRYPGEVVLVEPLGQNNLVSIRVEDGELRVLSGKALKAGEAVELSFSPRDAYFFDLETGLRLKN